MKPDEVEQITRMHARLWNLHDAEGVAELYSDDCTYEDCATGATMRGKDELIAHAQGMFARIPDMTVNLRSVMASASHSAREYVITGSWAATGKPISLPGVSVLEFDGEAIKRNTDYYDLATLMKQVAE